MNPIFLRYFSVVVLALAAVSLQLKARAGTLAENDAQQIQALIAAQLSAFAEDDADRAFETATPEVRKAIGSSARFLAMVRGAYPMVYRPAQVSFLKPEEEEGQVLQLVEIRDDDDKSWLALFAMERQPDQSWRIGGCLVAENRWHPA
ncbi:MAG: DUF4864 domain-containing protein [Pseudomonadota bacterium]